MTAWISAKLADGLCSRGGDDSIPETGNAAPCLRHLIQRVSQAAKARITKEFGLPRAKLSEDVRFVSRVSWRPTPIGGGSRVFENMA